MNHKNTPGDLLYDECAAGAQVDLPGLLAWLADRLEHVYGENPNVDFVLTTRSRAKRLRLAMDAYEAEKSA